MVHSLFHKHHKLAVTKSFSAFGLLFLEKNVGHYLLIIELSRCSINTEAPSDIVIGRIGQQFRIFFLVQLFAMTIVNTDFRSSLFLRSLLFTHFCDTQEAEILFPAEAWTNPSP